MPNGFDGTREDWDRLEAQFLEWDATLDDFAREHGLTLSRNDHGWPARSLEAVDASLRRKVELVASDQPRGTFDVWAYAWKDVGGRRLSKVSAIRRHLPAAEMAGHLPEILHEAWETSRGWSDRDLN